MMPEKKNKVDLMIGADHAGYDLKASILKMLSTKGIRWEDAGTFDDHSVDYPDFAFKVAKAVASSKVKRGILICGTGIGMSITANRVPGVRAALCNDLYTVRMARAHNNANILALGSRVVGTGLALEIVLTFLTTRFEKGRHLRRIKKMDKDPTKQI
jgi:ribose 5-phosphate isomerase B